MRVFTIEHTYNGENVGNGHENDEYIDKGHSWSRW